MEAVAAVALAGNVLQFVQVSLTIISKGNNLKRSRDGTLKEHSELSATIENLDSSLSRLDGNHDPTLSVLVSSCKDVGKQLRDALAEIKSKGGRKSAWSSYRQALSIVWNKSTLEEVEARLERLRNEMSFHLQTTINNDIASLLDRSSEIDGKLKLLEDNVDETREAVLTNNARHTTDLQNKIEEIRSLQQKLLELQTAYEDHYVKPSPFAFLDTLRFRGMNSRLESIPEAHVATYQWLLKAPLNNNSDGSQDHDASFAAERDLIKNGVIKTLEDIGVDTSDDFLRCLREEVPFQCDHLQEFLKTDSGLFWIWGKPGCGKSTLMKSLRRDRSLSSRLSSLLGQWAGETKLVIADFFFFRPGMTLQKSQEGFFRSLLYRVLSEEVELIDKVFSVREQCQAIARHKKLLADEADVWTLSELETAYKLWRENSDAKIFLHIDGLDEIDCPPRDVIEILDMVKHANVKILAAGRWAPEYERAFDQQKSLMLHVLTELDILKFTVDTLGDTEVIDILDDPAHQFLAIIRDICVAAQGVFQWVSVVVKSLLQGTTYFENFEQLFARLKEYPPDLNKLYWFLYESIDTRHISDAALWLLITEYRVNPPRQSRPFTGTTIEMHDSNRIFPTLDAMRYQGISTTAKPTSQSWDLLRMHYAGMFDSDDPNGFEKLVDSALKDDALTRSRLSTNMRKRMMAQCRHFFDLGKLPDDHVGLAHRTVLDFLARQDVRSILTKRLKSGKHPAIAWIATSTAVEQLAPLTDGSASRGEFLHLPLILNPAAQLDISHADKLWKQLTPVLSKFDIRNAGDGIWWPDIRGKWTWAPELTVLRSLLQGEHSIAHLYALYHSRADICKAAHEYSLDSETRELLIVEQAARTFHNLGSLGANDPCSDQDMFNELFVSGVPQRSLGLRLLLRQLLMFTDGVDWRYSYEKPLDLSAVFVTHGADPNAVFEHGSEKMRPLDALAFLFARLASESDDFSLTTMGKVAVIFYEKGGQLSPPEAHQGRPGWENARKAFQKFILRELHYKKQVASKDR